MSPARTVRDEVNDLRSEFNKQREDFAKQREETRALTVAVFGHPDAPGETGMVKDVADTKEAVERGVDRLERLYQSLLTLGIGASAVAVTVFTLIH